VLLLNTAIAILKTHTLSRKGLHLFLGEVWAKRVLGEVRSIVVQLMLVIWLGRSKVLCCGCMQYCSGQGKEGCSIWNGQGWWLNMAGAGESSEHHRRSC